MRCLAVAGAALILALAATGCRSWRKDRQGDEPAFRRVRPAVAFEMLRDTPQMPILDLRSRYEFTGPAGHLRGARNVPVEELDQLLIELLPIKERTFLVYCGHDDCGAQGMTRLLAAGFEEVVLMDGGLDSWVELGFGTVTGPPPPMLFSDETKDDYTVD